VSVPYHQWNAVMPVITQNIIEAAEHANATIIFPGNNYNFGKTDQLISEVTPFDPCAPTGRVRVTLERMLQHATDHGRIRTLVVRMAELWGPNVTNKQFAPVFENALKGWVMPWLISADTPQQLLYAPDAARAILMLTERTGTQPYEVFNLGGTMVPSIRGWMQSIAQTTGEGSKVSVTPLIVVRALGVLIPLMREVSALSYKFNTTVALSDAKFSSAFPNFRQTDMQTAIAETLKWFAANGSAAPQQIAAKKARRRETLFRFVVDNIAITVFPAALALAASQIPFLQSFLPYLAVAAGIYWTPGLHKLTQGWRNKFTQIA